MRVLIAEDDPVSRVLLKSDVAEWGYEVTAVGDGVEAWNALQGDDRPHVAILDWMMPGMDGIEICRRARAQASSPPTYIILLTAKDRTEDIVSGLGAGADDFVAKATDSAELRMRVQVGMRMVQLQLALADRVTQLEEAMAQVQQLQGLIPICSYCKRVRDDEDYWQQVESYIAKHSAATFSHGICPDCLESTVEPMLREHRLRRKAALPAKHEGQ